MNINCRKSYKVEMEIYTHKHIHPHSCTSHHLHSLSTSEKKEGKKKNLNKKSHRPFGSPPHSAFWTVGIATWDVVLQLIIILNKLFEAGNVFVSRMLNSYIRVFVTNSTEGISTEAQSNLCGSMSGLIAVEWMPCKCIKKAFWQII